MADEDITREIEGLLDEADRVEIYPAISHYRVLEKLGEGGMGIVYKAEDEKLQRIVALKFLKPKPSAGEEQRSRFIKEAQSAASLDHPNICTVYEIDEFRGQIFIAMAFIQGTNLKERIRRGRLSVEKAVHIALQIAKGLDAAHLKGIVHRDVKSSNIMVTDRSHARIMDFGLAVTGDTGLVLPGRLVGTPAYMSPEQLTGEKVDRRTDIWSWGVLLFEMLTSRLPFEAETYTELVRSILHSPIRPPSQLNPEVPPGLDNLVEKALSKQPKGRFQSLREVLEILEPKQTFDVFDTWTDEPPKRSTLPSIAVLPFSDMSADQDQSYFCDGIADEIINSLTRIEGLRVTARTSAFSFRERQLDIREIGRKLRVSTVLEGSVRKLANRIRVTAQLINVSDGFHLWSERYDREIQDIFAIQEEIAQRIVQALRSELTERERDLLKRPSTRSVRAYEYYLRGRQFFYRSKRDAIEFALEMYSRAISEDPGYPLAYAGTADCYSYLYMYHGGEPSHLTSAVAAGRKALDLDPGLAEAHAAQGLVLSLTEDYSASEREFEEAIRLNPGLFEAHYFYARTCFSQGKLDEAAKRFKLAAKVNPDDYQAISLLGCTYKGLKQEDKMLEAFRRTLMRVRQRLELNPDDARAYYLGAHALLETGDRIQAIEWAEKTRLMGKDDPYFLYGLACFYTQLGDTEKALHFLEQAIDKGFAHRGWAENDADLNPLRGDSRFDAILARLDR